MNRPEQKIVQYLEEAHAMERGLVRVLQSQIAMTPRGAYRKALETHLRETRDHSERVQRRLRELRRGANPLDIGRELAESLLGQAIALSKLPLDLLRGSGGEEKVLKAAKDTAATEALEIATYTALARLARDVGDDTTAALAESICADEQKMLERVLRELPRLTDAVVGAEVHGNGSYELSRTGAADAGRAAGRAAARTARGGRTRARKAARSARRVPGVARAEGQVKGAVASAQDLPIPDYDKRSAAEIVEQLPKLSQVDLAKVQSYERRHDGRTTVVSRTESLRRDEPWPGYDEQTVEDVRAALRKADRRTLSDVRDYERAHKGRGGVLEETERAPAAGASAR
jgi:ferritin-like metal-binding protein YciE